MKQILLLILSFCPLLSNSQVIIDVETPGKVKSILKGKANLSSLVVNGTLSIKDVESIKNLPNLKVLNLKNALLASIPNNKFKVFNQIDTLYLPSNIEYTAAGSSFWNIFSKTIVKDDLVYINSYGADSFNGIQAFPKNENVFSSVYKGEVLEIKDGVIIDSYFGSSKQKKMVFGANLKRIEDGAFENCIYLEELEFQSSDFTIGKKGIYMDKLKKVIVPKGQKGKFVSMGFSQKIIVEQGSARDLELYVKEAGSLIKHLDGIDLKDIRTLKIKGEMDFSDLSTIREMRNIEAIDLSAAFISESAADRSQKVADMQYVAQSYSHDSEAKLIEDHNILEYEMRNKVESAMDKTIKNTANEPLERKCQLPRGAFKNLPYLSRIVLPAYLSETGYYGSLFEGSTNLKEIWCCKSQDSKVDYESIGKHAKAQIRYYTR